jgi:hypothetical protein
MFAVVTSHNATGETTNGIQTTIAISGILSPSLVQEQLEEVLASPFFRASKRCSQMLRYIMEQFMLDPSVRLKERTIGLTVFGRSPDYDTSNDTIVRSTAGEIRKRLAQYYAEQTEAAVLITLPAGSYFPVISVGRQGKVSPVGLKPNPLGYVAPSLTSRKSSILRMGWFAVLALAVGLMGAVGVVRYLRTRPTERFWNPMRTAGLPPIICLGDTTQVLLNRGDIDAVVEESKYGINSNDRMAFGDVIALNSFVSFLVPLTGKPDVRHAATTSFADLQRQPAILIGGHTNQWTARAMKFLRFRFQQGKSPGILEVIDSKNPSNPLWRVDFNTPVSQTSRDYAIIARFTDPETNQPTVITAGAGPNGTIAGAQCLTSSVCLQNIANLAPRGWEKRNIEVVMETEMIEGARGPSRILRVHVW